MGLANASPTITRELTRRSDTVRHSSAGEKFRDVRVTIEPPVFMAPNAENCPVPCISGQAGSITDPGPVIRDASSSTEVLGGRPRRGLPPAPSSRNRSPWRHITPLGIPVVPPVYSIRMSSPERPHGPATRSAPAETTGSYGVAQSGTGVPSSTTYHRFTPGRRSRTFSSSSAKQPWKTTASASAFSKRYATSSGPYR